VLDIGEFDAEEVCDFVLEIDFVDVVEFFLQRFV
jgi:hypothetical protein